MATLFAVAAWASAASAQEADLPCDGLKRTAADAELAEGLQLDSDGTIVADDNVENQYGALSRNLIQARFCFTIEAAGDYYISGEATGPDPQSDSFFVVTPGRRFPLGDDGCPLGGVEEAFDLCNAPDPIADGEYFAVWHLPPSDVPTQSYVREFAEYDPMRGPVVMRLGPGEQSIRVYHREAGARLASLELRQVRNTQEPASPTCGGLAQEAESGALGGSILLSTRNDADSPRPASGGQNVAAPPWADRNFTPDQRDRAEYCVTAPASGRYVLQATAIAPGKRHDSFFVQVGDEEPFAWHLPPSRNWDEQFVTRPGQIVPAVFDLTEDENKINFLLREPGTLLDKFEFIPVDGVTPEPEPVTPEPEPVTPEPEPVTPEPTPEVRCVVGDDCPLYRAISSQGRCVQGSNGVGDSIQVGARFGVTGNCSSRANAYFGPNNGLHFLSNGQIRLERGINLCISAELGELAEAASCAAVPEQQWSVDDEGRILADDGSCLVDDERALRRADCDQNAEPRWAFIPVASGENFDVQVVYLTAADSTRTDRGELARRAAADNQSTWADFGATWNLNTTLLTVNLPDTACAEVTFDFARRTVARVLAEEGFFTWDTKYLILQECAGDGVANALDTTAVFGQFILDGIESQIDAADELGSQPEVGSLGHELGHLFGLDHENCVIGGYQGGVNEEGADRVRERPTAATTGPMCNGVYYPAVSGLSPIQIAVLYDKSCRWIEECSGDAEYAADGRPFGCGLAGATLFWDTARPDLTFTVYAFSFETGEVERYAGLPGRSFALDLPGEAYLAVSLDSQTEPEQRQACGLFRLAPG